MFDQVSQGIHYITAFRQMPEYFDLEAQILIRSVFVKWQNLEEEYECIEDAISVHCFTDEEVRAYALWRAAVYFSENSCFTADLAKKSFEANLEKLTQYYTAMSRGEA